MTTRLTVLCCLCLPLLTRAGDSIPNPGQFRTSRQLDDLLGPIALYPDPLIALMLPAATEPSDITLAARDLANGEDTDQIADQPWDESIKSLTHYPAILKWMDDNLEWTMAIGESYRVQPKDVMASIQRLRVKAKYIGNLKTTPEQKVVTEDGAIRVVPAEDNVIYVPEYDPDIVYEESGPFVSFGFGYSVGPWLDYDCDWGYGDGIWVGAWSPGWRTHRRGWGHAWEVNPYRPHPGYYFAEARAPLPKPTLSAGSRSWAGNYSASTPRNSVRPANSEAPLAKGNASNIYNRGGTFKQGARVGGWRQARPALAQQANSSPQVQPRFHSTTGMQHREFSGRGYSRGARAFHSRGGGGRGQSRR